MEYGLIGAKLSHSFSKDIHQRIGGYVYELVELNETEFVNFMENKDFKAINVTIPYKEKVIPYLDYISDEAKSINAVNTIINKNGKLYGYNTDYLGLKEMILYFNIKVKNKSCVILGHGGTAKTANYVLKDLKAKEITFVSKYKEENCLTYEQLEDFYDKDCVIVNTTPCEMYPNIYDKIINLNKFNKVSGVIDVVFNPLKTNLVLSALNKKVNSCSGLYMLVAQAFYAIQLFLNKDFDKNLIDEVYNDILFSKQNIVLIGMPSCGKTTIGKIIAKRLNKKFYDVDDEIIKIIKMEISEYFKKYGEKKFREIESDVIKKLALENDCVIATGGGSILKEENVINLKHNGKLYFLNRSLSKLTCTSSRPLSSNKEKLRILYSNRYNLYLKHCDVKINANQSINKIVNDICGGYNYENFNS